MKLCLHLWYFTKLTGVFLCYILLQTVASVFRSGFRSAAPQPVAPTAQTTARKMTALWFCWPQTRAARAPKLANTTTATTATVAAAALLSPPFPLTPCLLCKASASLLAPKKARLAAARHAPPRRKSGSSPRMSCSPLLSAPAVPCLQAAGSPPPKP